MRPETIRSLHQIEMTSRCNLRCRYCTHPNLGREKRDMDHETFIKCLELAARYVKQGTQFELNLAGIGESTIHPRFVEYTRLAREAIGRDCRLVLSTNGVAVTEDMVAAIAATGILVWVSPHRPEKAEAAIRYLIKYGLFQGLSQGAWTGSVDWAGQVDWPVTAPTKGTLCPWVINGRVTVFSDGRVSRCCFDSDGCGVICTVDELMAAEQVTTPFELCGPCHHEVDPLAMKLNPGALYRHERTVTWV